MVLSMASGLPSTWRSSMAKLWMKNTSQFTVVTLEQYTKTPQKVASFISNRIKFKQETVIEAPEHKHEREHPKMIEKTTSKLLKIFEDDEQLFDKLVKKHCMAMECGSGISYM